MNENGLQGNDGGTNKFGNHDSFGNEASNQINEGSNDLHEDFQFSENDTIGTIIHTEYRQDQKIKYKNTKGNSDEDIKSKKNS